MYLLTKKNSSTPPNANTEVSQSILRVARKHYEKRCIENAINRAKSSHNGISNEIYNFALLSITGGSDRRIKRLVVLLVNLSRCHLDVMDEGIMLE